MDPIPWQAAAVATLKRLVLHTALWGNFFLGMLFAMPVVERVYRDFKPKLPAMAEQLVALSRLLIASGYLLPLAFLCLLAMDGTVYFLLRRGPGTRAWSTVWSGLLIALSQVALWWLFIGAWLPLIRVHEAMAR